MLNLARNKKWGRLILALILPLAVILLFGMFYVWKLDTVTNGLSSAELNSINKIQNWSDIVDSPLFAPHRAIQFLVLKIDPTSILLARLPSVAFMALFLGLFYLLVRLWFGRMIGLMGVLMLAGTPWVTLIARSALPDILYLAPLAMIALYLWLNRRQTYLVIVWIALVITVGLSLYIPGAMLFLLVVSIFKYSEISKILNKIGIFWVASCSILVTFIAVPLVWGLILQPSLAFDLLLIPTSYSGPLEDLKSIIWAGLSLFWRLPYVTDLTVGRLPLMTISLLALSIFGGFAMLTRARRQTYGLAGILISSIILAGLVDRLTILLPAIMILCIFAAAGLRYLFVEWNSIFPRNPIPRYFAVALMCVLVSLHLYYGWRYSHVAWPNSPATKRIYVLELKS